MAVILDLYLKFSMISSHSHMDVFQMHPVPWPNHPLACTAAGHGSDEPGDVFAAAECAHEQREVAPDIVTGFCDHRAPESRACSLPIFLFPSA